VNQTAEEAVIQSGGLQKDKKTVFVWLFGWLVWFVCFFVVCLIWFGLV